MKQQLISRRYRSWLNDRFHDRWIGRGGLISWALRSPDLTPLDFFSMKTYQTNVYSTKIKDLDDLKIKITEEIEAIKKETLKNVFFLKSEKD